MKIGIILLNNNRSKAYIQKITKNDILLNEIIFLNDSKIENEYSKILVKTSKIYGFDISESVKTTLINKKLEFKEFPFTDINSSELIDYIKKTELDYVIFTGGGILKSEILNLKTKFIHLHPGITPNYRGSTCFYYSILNENNCGVTSFIMNEGLDTGDILYQRVFQKPNHLFVDDVFDSYIRSETLIDLLNKDILLRQNFEKQNLSIGTTYYIIHPVLKHIAILSCS